MNGLLLAAAAATSIFGVLESKDNAGRLACAAGALFALAVLL